MRFRFTLIDYTVNSNGTTTVLDDEPDGWAELEIKIQRDNEWHGIFFDYSLNKLSFHDEAYSVINTAYNLSGCEANTELLIEIACDDDDAFEELYLGRLQYDEIKFNLQDYCSVTIPVSQIGCFRKFKNRFDQQVDLTSNRTFGLSAASPDDLTSYTELNQEIEIPSKPIFLHVEATMEENYSYGWATPTYGSGFIDNYHYATFDFLNVTLNEFDALYGIENELDGNITFTDFTGVIEGTLENLASGEIICTQTGRMDIEVALKGNIALEVINGSGIDTNHADTIPYDLQFALWHTYEAGLPKTIELLTPDFNGNWHNVFLSSGVDDDFDITFSGSYDVEAGDKFFLVITYHTLGSDFQVFQGTVNIEFESGRFFGRFKSQCDPTNSRVFLINEALSRTAEIISDDCLRVYSDYFGRIDAEPYASDEDGCAGFTAINNGLFLRRATKTDGSSPSMFVSMKQLFDGLNPIHNIGIGLEDDPNPGRDQRLRFEPVRHFYQDNTILTLTDVKEIERKFSPKRAIALIQIGYSKWESEYSGGLDEFLSKREFRSELTQVDTKLTKLSNLIASGYAIEVTRRQGQTTQDYAYDQDIFIFCLDRMYTSYIVETFSDLQIENILSPDGLINIRISPVRNFLRWYKSIRTVASSRMRFNAGDANYIAKIRRTTNDNCLLETQADYLQEDNNISPNNFKDSNDATPIWLPETISFEYPLTYQQFKLIKNNPTGLITVTSSGNSWSGFIDEITYIPVEGLAKFTLLRKWS